MRGLTKKQAGFTLVELLVVVGIIVALAAAIIPNIARFTGSGQSAGADSELKAIQAALDTAIADNGLTTVFVQTAAADFSSAGAEAFWNTAGDPLVVGGELYLYPTYLRVKDAGYGPYSWTAEGLVTRD